MAVPGFAWLRWLSLTFGLASLAVPDFRLPGFRLSLASLAKRPDLGMVLDRIRNKHERAGVAEHLAAAFPGQTFRG